MNLAEQLEQDEKYEEAYTEYKKQLPHKQNDVELLTKLAHVALILEKKDDAKMLKPASKKQKEKSLNA